MQHGFKSLSVLGMDSTSLFRAVRRTSQERHLLSGARKLMGHVVSMLDEPSAARVRELPAYVQLMGEPDGPSITRIARAASPREPAGRDFDFSLDSILTLMEEGMRAGRQALSTR